MHCNINSLYTATNTIRMRDKFCTVTSFVQVREICELKKALSRTRQELQRTRDNNRSSSDEVQGTETGRETRRQTERQADK
jgi:hypothetical protein